MIRKRTEQNVLTELMIAQEEYWDEVQARGYTSISPKAARFQRLFAEMALKTGKGYLNPDWLDSKALNTAEAYFDVVQD